MCQDSSMRTRLTNQGHCYQIKLEFGMLGFFHKEGKPEYLKKSHKQTNETNNKLNPYVTLGLKFEPRLHWWEASALTTAPDLCSPDWLTDWLSS